MNKEEGSIIKIPILSLYTDGKISFLKKIVTLVCIQPNRFLMLSLEKGNKRSTEITFEKSKSY